MNAVAIQARPKKLLVVLYSFGLGGSEIVGLQLAKKLADFGAQVLCAAIDSTPGPLQELCAAYGIETLDLRIPSNVFERNGTA